VEIFTRPEKFPESGTVLTVGNNWGHFCDFAVKSRQGEVDQKAPEFLRMRFDQGDRLNKSK